MIFRLVHHRVCPKGKSENLLPLHLSRDVGKIQEIMKIRDIPHNKSAIQRIIICFTVQISTNCALYTGKSVTKNNNGTACPVLLLTPLGCPCLCLLWLVHQCSLEKLHSVSHYQCCMISRCRSRCLLEYFYHDPCQIHLHVVISPALYYLGRVLPLPCLFAVSCHQVLSHQVQVPAELPLDCQSLHSQTFRLQNIKRVIISHHYFSDRIIRRKWLVRIHGSQWQGNIGESLKTARANEKLKKTKILLNFKHAHLVLQSLRLWSQRDVFRHWVLHVP